MKKISDEASEIISTLIAGRPYKVSERLASPHPLVAEALTQLSNANTDKYGILVGPWKKTHVDVRVSSKMLGRALRLMDAIIKLFESKNLSLYVDKGKSSRDTHVKLFDEKVSFFIREPSRRYDHELNAKEKEDLKHYGHSFAQKYDYKPSGVLTIEIDAYATGNVRKRWSDGKKNSIEDYLLDFMIGIVKMADISRSERTKWEAEQKRWEEERERRAELQRQQELEKQRLRELENQADRWIKSNYLREYIRAVETISSQKDWSEGEKIKNLNGLSGPKPMRID